MSQDEIERVSKALDKCAQERGHRIPATIVRHLAEAAIDAMQSHLPDVSGLITGTVRIPAGTVISILVR